MINKWILDNFKSIDKEKELEFRPLTIFTGANSSGKSTILQSILLVTQTLQSQNSSRSIVLNGHIKKFGSYTDIVHRRQIDRNIKIGFDISEDKPEDDNFVLMYRHKVIRSPHVLRSYECKFEISSANDKESLQPKLEHVNISILNDNDKVNDLEVVKSNGKPNAQSKELEQALQRYPSSDFDYVLKGNPLSRFFYFRGQTSWKYIGAGLNHFLPRYVIGYSSYKAQIKNFLTDYLTIGRTSYYEMEQSDEKVILPLIKEKALAIADELWNKEMYSNKTTFLKKYESIKKRFTIPKLQALVRYSKLDGDEIQKYIKQIVDLLDAIPEKYITERMPLHYHPGIDYIYEFFNDKIKYLGPLREEPKSLYPLETGSSSTALGLKGENTASVFDDHKNDVISFVDPVDFNNGENLAKSIKKCTLAEAINKWLVYLGVASDMSTIDKGKIGHELKIVTDVPDLQQDLTHVGVGVSQVLPILVMSFLAKEGDVIILEQPELHLHPKIQTRLAEFFVTMNALGKQCLIETHSEYLINRLRYLVAINKSKENKVADDTMIYFVEKEDGHSKYRPVTINKYGVIEDWPEGFFDESEKIAAQILRAGMEKKTLEEGDDYEE